MASSNTTGVTLSRRQLLQRGAAAGGALAVGSQLPPGVRPIGKAEGIAITTAVVAFTAGAVATAGAVYAKNKLFGSDEDPTQNVEDWVHGIATGVASQRSKLWDEWDSQYVGVNKLDTPFAKSASQSSEAGAVNVLRDGNNATVAKSAAKEEIDRQYVIALHNHIQDWNRAIIGGQNTDSLLAATVLEQSAGTGQINIASSQGWELGSCSAGEFAFEAVPESEIWGGWPPADGDDDVFGQYEEPSSGEYTVFRKEWDPVIDPTNIQELRDKRENPDDPVMIYGIVIHSDPGYQLAGPWDIDGNTNNWAVNETAPDVTVSHPEASSVKPMRNIRGDVYDKITASYDEVRSRSNGWVDRLAQMDPDELPEVLGPRQLMDQYENQTGRGYFAASAAAAGIDAPEELGRQMEIKQGAFKQFGNVWIDFTDAGLNDGNRELQGGDVLGTDEFRSIYISYLDSNGTRQREMLVPADGTVEILQVSGSGPINYQDSPSTIDPEAQVSDGAIKDRLTYNADTSDQIGNEGWDGSTGGIFGLGDFGGDLKKWAIIGGGGLLLYGFVTGS